MLYLSNMNMAPYHWPVNVGLGRRRDPNVCQRDPCPSFSVPLLRAGTPRKHNFFVLVQRCLTSTKLLLM